MIARLILIACLLAASVAQAQLLLIGPAGPVSGGSATPSTNALLLVNGVSNLLLVDGTDNLCLVQSTSC